MANTSVSQELGFVVHGEVDLVVDRVPVVWHDEVSEQRIVVGLRPAAVCLARGDELLDANQTVSSSPVLRG